MKEKADFLQVVCAGENSESGKPSCAEIQGISVHPTAIGGETEDAGCASRRIRVLCVGDSITYGSGSADDRETPGNRDTTRNYPGLLQAALGYDCEVLNCGLSGATVLNDSAGTTPNGYLASSTGQKALASEADLVLIMLGTNDSKPHIWVQENNGVTEYREAFKTLVMEFMNLEAKPEVYVLLSPPSLPEGVNGSNYMIDNSVLTSYIVPTQRAVAAELGVGVIDVHSVFPDPASDAEALCALLVDGVHPNSAGYARMTAEIADAVKDCLTGRLSARKCFL